MRVIRLAIGVLALSILLFGLAACGGDDGSEKPAATQTSAAEARATEEPGAVAEPEATETVGREEVSSGVDPCDLVTKADAETALGAPAGEPKMENTPPVSACSYETADFNSVEVLLTTFENADQAEDAFQMAIDINDYPEVSGLGDRAYDSRPIFDVTVLKGRYEVDVTVNLEGDETDFETAKELAATAVERLP